MQAIIESLNAAAQVWADRMWAMLWQSTLLAAVVAFMAVLLLRHSSPSARYWVWQIVALKLLLMPFWMYALPLPQFGTTKSVESSEATQAIVPRDAVSSGHHSPATTGAPAVTRKIESALPVFSAESTAPASPARMSWPSWLLCGWGAIIVAHVVRLIRQRNRLSRLLREATPADETMVRLVRELSGRLRLRQVPRVVLTAQGCSPFVCGARRAVVVLPRELTASLTAKELQHVVLHELAHVRRRDLVWGWIGELARVVYFFHPVVHWISYRLRLERELACDKLAMSFSGHEAGEYAATLVRVISHSSEPSVFKTAAASASLNGGLPP